MNLGMLTVTTLRIFQTLLIQVYIVIIRQSATDEFNQLSISKYQLQLPAKEPLTQFVQEELRKI